MSVLALIHALPKAELHLHLEGSLSEIYWNELNPDVAGRISAFRRQGGKSLGRFLQCMEVIHRALRTPSDYGAATLDLLGCLEKENIRYVEITWAPGGIWEFHNISPQDVYPEIEAAIEEYESRVDARVLVDLIRNQPLQMALDIVNWVDRFRPRRVVGINVGGDEVRFSIDGLLPAIRRAREIGLGVSIHAGEAVSEAQMLAAVRVASPDRVGHGTSLQSKFAESLFLELGLHIEACPTSNQTLGYLDSAGRHPLLTHQGLRGSLNTDDRSFFSSALSEELAMLVDLHGIPIREIARYQCQAAADAFARDSSAALAEVTAAWLAIDGAA
jgi:adenosine deaminase